MVVIGSTQGPLATYETLSPVAAKHKHIEIGLGGGNAAERQPLLPCLPAAVTATGMCSCIQLILTILVIIFFLLISSGVL